MITALAARWLLTAVFAAAGLGTALPRRGRADAAGRVPAVFCVVMCAALIAMIRRSDRSARGAFSLGNLHHLL
jgi:hypothetical protein